MKIRIDGIPSPVTVDDAFADLSPEEQGAIVDEIHRQYTGGAQQKEAEGEYVSAFRASQQQAEQESATAGQLAGGLAAGLARGLADVPALPVNLLQLGTLGVEKLLGMEQPSAVSRLLESLPETRNILPEAASYVAPGRAGQFASTIGEFAGGAAGTFGAGAGVSALRAGTRGVAPLLTAAGKGAMTPDVLKYGAAAGAGSEALGQIAEDTDVEGAARLVGALATPMVIGGATRALRSAIKAADERPSLDTFYDRKTAAYKAVDDSGVVVQPAAIDRIYANSVQAARSTPNYVPQVDEATNSALALLDSIRGPQSMTISQLDKVRQQLNNLYRSNRNQVSILDMVDSVDDAISGALQSAGAGPLMEIARSANSAFKKVELLDMAMDTAKTGAAVSGSGGNVVNKYRQAVAAILRNPRQLSYFNSGEIEAMKRIARGNLPENVLRSIGKLSPTGGGLMKVINFAAIVHNPFLLAGSAVAAGSKKASEMLMERNLADLRQLFATGQMPTRTPALAQRGAVGLLPSVTTGLLGQ